MAIIPYDGESLPVPSVAQLLPGHRALGPVIFPAGGWLVPGQDDYYPEVESIDAASPLGGLVRRLSEALDAAEARATRVFTAELTQALPHLRRYALSLVRHATEAEDLVQFTLLKAWEHRASYRPGTALKAWLFTILRNGMVNGRRKRRLEVPDSDGTHAATLETRADQEHRLDVQDVQEALGRLDPAQREALLLVAVEDMTYEAAAERLGCPPGTVKSRVSRARGRLAVELGEG